MTVRSFIRRILPFRLRRALLNARRLPRWAAEGSSMARRHVGPEGVEAYPWILSAHASPLERVPGAVRRDLQRGKEANVALAARLLDGIVVAPGQVFSYHHTVGPPSRRRGFRPGLELRDGRPRSGVGGGLCQVSNGLYWTAVQAGMRIVERHRHGLDLFPDHQRTVPFGCGATVAYRRADLRFQNPFGLPVVLRTRVDGATFTCELRTAEDPGVRVEVWEADHRFFRAAEGWMRENRLRRRITRADGSLLMDEEVAHNLGRVLYEPTPERSTGSRASTRAAGG